MSSTTASPLKGATINPTADGFAAAAVTGQLPPHHSQAPPPHHPAAAAEENAAFLKTTDSADFATTTTDANLPFVTVAPKRAATKARTTTAAPLRSSPSSSLKQMPPRATTAAAAAAADHNTSTVSSTAEEDADGLNGDTLRNGTAGTAARYKHDLRNVPVASVFNWIQQYAVKNFSCHMCGDFLGACVDGFVLVAPAAAGGGVLMCNICRNSETGITSYPLATFSSSSPPDAIISAIADLQEMLKNPLSSIVQAATNNSNSANTKGAAEFVNGADGSECDDDAPTTPNVTTTPLNKKSRFLNPNQHEATDFAASSTTASAFKNNTTFSPTLAKKKKSLGENGSPNVHGAGMGSAAVPPVAAAPSAPSHNTSADGSENEPPTTHNHAANNPPSSHSAQKISGSSPSSSPQPTPPAVIAAQRLLQQQEEQYRTKINVEEGVAFVQFEKRAAGNLKAIRSQKRGSSKQFKIEADEAYEKAKYHVAIELYDKAIDQVGDGTTRLSVLYGNRSAALFMAMRYEDCIEDCLRVAAKHQQQQNAATGGGEGVPQVAAMNGMVKMYQRAIKAATMMGDLERALTLYNKIDASATTEQMNVDRMKVMMAVDELREAKKLHCTPEGDRLWEVLISKFGDALMFRVKYAESLASAGKMEKAVDVLSIIQPPARPPHVAHKIALYKYRSGFEHFEGARETLEPFVATDEECKKLFRLINDVDDEKQRGNQLFSSRQFAASVTHYTKAVDLDTTNDRILRILYCNRAAAFKELSKLQEGVDDCTRAIALDANFSKAYARRARCLMNMKEYDGAVRDFKHASKCDPNDRELARELKNAEDHLAKEVEKEKDHYYMLGVTKTSTDAEVKKKYRELSLKWHPDKCMAQTEEEKVVSERKFKAVSEAYTILMNAEKRREYDLKCDRERYTSAAYGGGYGSAFASAGGGYRSSTTAGGPSAAGAGGYRSGASRWSKYGAGAGAAGGPGTGGSGGGTAGFW